MYSEKIIANLVQKEGRKRPIGLLHDGGKSTTSAVRGGTSDGLVERRGGHFERAVDHYVSGFDNTSRMFTYLVFSDPQIGGWFDICGV